MTQLITLSSLICLVHPCSTLGDPADKPWLLSTCPAVLSQDSRSRPHKINHAHIQIQKIGAFLDYFKIQSCNLMFYFIIN